MTPDELQALCQQIAEKEAQFAQNEAVDALRMLANSWRRAPTPERLQLLHAMLTTDEWQQLQTLHSQGEDT